MHRVLAIAMVFGGWTLSMEASAQSLERRSTPPIQTIPTVEDAPQGTAEALERIEPIVTDSSGEHTQPTVINFSNRTFRFSDLTQPYTSYSNLTFETPITPDRVKLRVNYEPDREGGNFGLGLPLE